MRKFIVLLMVCSFLTGCASRSKNQVQMDIYESYYQSISETTKFTDETPYYSLEGEIVQAESGKYSYYIVLDSVKTAMYNVVMMAVENHISFDSSVKMMPSIGIFDDACHLIPNQINVEKGYAEGIVISGETQDEQVSLNMIVEWKNEKGTVTTRVFHSVIIDKDGLHFVGESGVTN